MEAMWAPFRFLFLNSYWLIDSVNIYFISILQNMLLGAAQLPQYLLLTLTKTYSPKFVSPPVGIYDYALVATFITILVLETIGDVQQQRYQVFKAEAKLAKKLSAEDQGKLTRGFITDGLWAYSRHPVSSHSARLIDDWQEGSFSFRISLVNNRLGTFFTYSLSYHSYQLEDYRSILFLKQLYQSPLSPIFLLSVELYKELFGITPFGLHWLCRCSSTDPLILLKRFQTPNIR